MRAKSIIVLDSDDEEEKEQEEEEEEEEEDEKEEIADLWPTTTDWLKQFDVFGGNVKPLDYNKVHQAHQDFLKFLMKEVKSERDYTEEGKEAMYAPEKVHVMCVNKVEHVLTGTSDQPLFDEELFDEQDEKDWPQDHSEETDPTKEEPMSYRVDKIFASCLAHLSSEEINQVLGKELHHPDTECCTKCRQAVWSRFAYMRDLMNARAYFWIDEQQVQHN
jgi:hypothetical protein